jgi:hypothetical protein
LTVKAQAAYAQNRSPAIISARLFGLEVFDVHHWYQSNYFRQAQVTGSCVGDRRATLGLLQLTLMNTALTVLSLQDHAVGIEEV